MSAIMGLCSLEVETEAGACVWFPEKLVGAEGVG